MNSEGVEASSHQFFTGGFKYVWNFHPYLGKIPNLTNIFQRGWNHQQVYFDLLKKVHLFFNHGKSSSLKSPPILHGICFCQMFVQPPNQQIRVRFWLRYLRYTCSKWTMELNEWSIHGTLKPWWPQVVFWSFSDRKLLQCFSKFYKSGSCLDAPNLIFLEVFGMVVVKKHQLESQWLWRMLVQNRV